MSTANSVAPSSQASTISAKAEPGVWTKVSDYVELSKPRIATMVLVTVSVGYFLGSRGESPILVLLHALIGIGLVAVSSCTLNQFLERDTDARMLRTANRPLPSGRLQPGEVLWFGIATGAVGFVYLYLLVNELTALLTLLTLAMYVGWYTPLKKKTWLCTAIGAIPGALPPVLGWTATGRGLDPGAISLFAIMFLWQFPHFLAIAWLYRNQYAAAGLRMLPSVIPRKSITGFMAVVYAIALIPISLLPYRYGMAGVTYFVIAMLLGLLYLAFSVRFMLRETDKTARHLLWTSLIYLPVILLSLTLNHWMLNG